MKFRIYSKYKIPQTLISSLTSTRFCLQSRQLINIIISLPYFLLIFILLLLFFKKKKKLGKMQQQGLNLQYNLMDSAEENLKFDLEDLLMQDNFQKMKIIQQCPEKRFKKFNDQLFSSALKTVSYGYDAEQGREVLWHSIKVKDLTKKELSRIHHQIFLIKSFKHEHIIHCIHSWVNIHKREIVFITEITNGGCLRNYLDKIKTTKLKVIKSWFQQILKALVFLHQQEKPIVHQSIRSQNMFINSTNNQIKIGEFDVLGNTLDTYYPLLGSYHWTAPEYSVKNIETSSDIYSFGMTMLEIITGKRPYSECLNEMEICKLVAKNVKPKGLENVVYEELKEIIQSCIVRDPKKRPTARQLLEHKFWQANQVIDNNSLKLIGFENKNSKEKKKINNNKQKPKPKQKSKPKSKPKLNEDILTKLSTNVFKKQTKKHIFFLFQFKNNQKYKYKIKKQQTQQFKQYITFLTKKFQDKPELKQNRQIILPFNKCQQKYTFKDDHTHFLSYNNPTMKTMRMDYLCESRVNDDHKKSVTHFSEINQVHAELFPKIQQMFLGMYEMYRNKLESWNIEETYQEMRFALEKRELEELQLMEKWRMQGEKKNIKNPQTLSLANSINLMDFLNFSEATWNNQIDITMKCSMNNEDALSLNYSLIHKNKEQKEPDSEMDNARCIFDHSGAVGTDGGYEKLNESGNEEEIGKNKSHEILLLSEEMMRESLENIQKEKEREKEREKEKEREMQVLRMKDQERQREIDKLKQKQREGGGEIERRQSKKVVMDEEEGKLHKLIFEKKPSITKEY